MTLIERNFFRRGENGGDISNVTLEANVSEVKLDGKILPESSVEYLLMFALQSLQDAYAGAKNLEEAKGMFLAKYDKLIAGTIGIRNSGESVSDEVRIGRKLMRMQIKANPVAWKNFVELSEEMQIEKLDINLEKNAAAMAPRIAAEIKRLADEKKAKALLGKELSFEL